MSILLFLLMCITMVLMIIGLIKPSLVIKWGELENRSRKKVIKLYGIIALLSFILCFVSLVPEDALFVLMFFLTPIFIFIFIVGLFKPSFVIKWGVLEKKTRKRVLMVYGPLVLISCVLFLVNTPELTAEEEFALEEEWKIKELNIAQAKVEAEQKEKEKAKKRAEKQVKENAEKEAKETENGDKISESKLEKNKGRLNLANLLCDDENEISRANLYAAIDYVEKVMEGKTDRAACYFRENTSNKVIVYDTETNWEDAIEFTKEFTREDIVTYELSIKDIFDEEQEKLIFNEKEVIIEIKYDDGDEYFNKFIGIFMTSYEGDNQQWKIDGIRPILPSELGY
jgi:hypothetical protein